MPRRLFSLACLLALTFAPGLLASTSVWAEEAKTNRPAPQAIAGQRVFVTGHSFHAWIGVPLAEIAKSAGIDNHTIAGKQSIGGSQVIQHWNKPDDANTAKQAIRKGEVDVLTVSPHLALPDEGIEKFTDLLLEHNPAGRVYVQASWYPYDLPVNYRSAFTNADRDHVKVADIREGYKDFYSGITKQVESINARLAAKAKRQVVFLVPVGHAVYALRDKIVAGEIPGTKQSDLFRDPIGHPQAPVAVLAAYCYYAAIYHRSPVGLPMPKLLVDAKNPAWGEKFNRTLQQIAWDAVTHEPLSGVKPAPGGEPSTSTP